jgi:type-IV secretion system protein TraC
VKDLYEKFARISAAVAGFSSVDSEYKKNALDELFEGSFLGAKPLRDFLCYRYFDKESGNFLLKNGAAGFTLEIAPIVGAEEKVSKSLNIFLAKELPKEGVLQFFLIASSDIDDFLEGWRAGRNTNHPILNKITELRVEYFRKQAVNFASAGKKLPRNFRIYVSYSMICRSLSSSALEEIKQFRLKISDKLSTLGLQPKLCKEEEIIRLVREFFEFSCNKPANYSVFNKMSNLADQALQHGNIYQSTTRAFINKVTGIATQAYCFRKIPDFWSLAQNIEMLGSNAAGQIPARFCLSLQVSNDLKTNKPLIARGKRVIDSAERPYSRHDKALQEEAGEWRDIIHRLVTDGDGALSESHLLFVSGGTCDIDSAVSEISSNMAALGWEILPLDYYHLEASLASMPMQGSIFWNELKKYKLVHTSLSSEIVSKLPIHAEWYGVPVSGVPFIGRRGQVFNWNPYHRLNSGNFNFNVAGPSGVGKSVFLQELASSQIAQGTRLFILDIGKSYASLAKLLKGEIIEFGSLSSFTINPFSGLKSDMNEEDFNAQVICAKELLKIMSGASGEYELALLEEQIKEAVNLKGFNLDIKSFVAFLKSSSNDLCHKFATSLYSYKPEGVFGKYFSGDNPARFDKDITVFEFEHVKDQPKLISIILQTLLMQITSQFLIGDRSRRFMIIVDEAWMLLQSSAGFFAAFGRNLRRYGGSLGICTQCFADLQTAGDSEENNNHRRAIFENSAWKISLPPGSFTDYESHLEFKYKIPLLQSLSFERGRYSEMLLSSSGYDVVGRLILDPFSAAIYSTESSDFNFLDKQEKLGIPIEQAIGELAKAKTGGGSGRI